MERVLSCSDAPTEITKLSPQPDHIPYMSIAVSHSPDNHSHTTNPIFCFYVIILCKEDALRRGASYRAYPPKPSSSPASYPTPAQSTSFETNHVLPPRLSMQILQSVNLWSARPPPSILLVNVRSRSNPWTEGWEPRRRESCLD